MSDREMYLKQTIDMIDALLSHADDPTVNPQDQIANSCFYTHPENPEYHCLFGQVLLDTKVATQEALDTHEGSAVDALLGGAFHPTRLFSEMQRWADGNENSDSSLLEPRPWSEVITKFTPELLATREIAVDALENPIRPFTFTPLAL